MVKLIGRTTGGDAELVRIGHFVGFYLLGLSLGERWTRPQIAIHVTRAEQRRYESHSLVQ